MYVISTRNIMTGRVIFHVLFYVQICFILFTLFMCFYPQLFLVMLSKLPVPGYAPCRAVISGQDNVELCYLAASLPQSFFIWGPPNNHHTFQPPTSTFLPPNNLPRNSTTNPKIPPSPPPQTLRVA
jgi:hypothetical protein